MLALSDRPEGGGFLTPNRVTERPVPGERSYQPLVAFCPKIGMAPWLEIRDHNVPAAMDNLRALDEVPLQPPRQIRQVTLHTDEAGYQEEESRTCSNSAFRRTRRGASGPATTETDIF